MKRLIAYRYTYGDRSEYWDCVFDRKWIKRCHSWQEVLNLAKSLDVRPEFISEVL